MIFEKVVRDSTTLLKQVIEVNKRTLFNVTVAALVLLLAVYVGCNPSFNYLVGLGGLAITVVFIRKPELGLIALLIAAFSIPFALSTNTQASFHAVFFLIPLLAMLWLVAMITQRNLRLAPALVNKPIVLLLVFSVISLVAGNLPWVYFANKATIEAQGGAWIIYVFSFLAFLLVANRLNQRWLKILCWLFLAYGSLVAIADWFPPVAALARLLVLPQAQGSLFGVWFVALAGGQALFNRSLSMTMRGTLGVLAVTLVAAGWIQGRSWISGWLPPLVGLGVLLYLKSWRVSILSALGMGLAILVFMPDILGTVIRDDQYSIDTRFLAGKILLGNLLSANPLLGLGFANYYHAASLYPVLGWYVRFNSHNQYVDIVMQMGVIGLGLFAWLVLALSRMAWTLRRTATDEFSRGYAYACLGGLAGTLVAGTLGDWFLPFLYNIGLPGFRASVLGWLFLGGLVVIQNSLPLRSDPR